MGRKMGRQHKCCIKGNPTCISEGNYLNLFQLLFPHHLNIRNKTTCNGGLRWSGLHSSFDTNSFSVGPSWLTAALQDVPIEKSLFRSGGSQETSMYLDL